MLKVGFITAKESSLAEDVGEYYDEMHRAILAAEGVAWTEDAERADLLILFEKTFFKTHRYLRSLGHDRWVKHAAERLLVINKDDFAHGLLPGLYTSLPASRSNPERHRTICYYRTPNPKILEPKDPVVPTVLGAFRGNLRGHEVRRKLFALWGRDPRFSLEATDSWLHHSAVEQGRFVDQIRGAFFSLCPRGWSPNSHRIFESMALGRCPVLIADDWNPPAGVDWSQCAVFLAEKKLADLSRFLEERREVAIALGAKAQENWASTFAPEVRMRHYLGLLRNLLENRPSGHLESFEQQRWKSRNCRRALNWAWDQRMRRRLVSCLYRALRKTTDGTP
jgi:hypothetical protein